MDDPILSIYKRLDAKILIYLVRSETPYYLFITSPIFVTSEHNCIATLLLTITFISKLIPEGQIELTSIS